MCIAGCNAELVVRPCIAEADKFDASVRIEIDQVAISWCAGDTGKKADTAIVALRYAIKLLLKNHPATNVTGQQQGLAAAGGRCLRNAVGCDALVGKATEMTPGAKFDLPGRVFIALFVIPS